MSHDFPEQPVELVAIINSFNRRSLSERAVTSLTGALRSARFGSAIIVFEAGSTDGSAEFLRTWGENHPADNVMVIESGTDRRSFSDGVNLGVTPTTVLVAEVCRCNILSDVAALPGIVAVRVVLT